jgi:hypothetical protein
MRPRHHRPFGGNLDTARLIEEILDARQYPVGSHCAQVAGFSGRQRKVANLAAGIARDPPER